MNTQHQVYCAYAGPLFVVLLTPIWYLTGFLPPLAPSMSPAEVAAFYEEHRSMIRFGATMLMQLAMLGVLWSAAISAQLRRIETGFIPDFDIRKPRTWSARFLVLYVSCDVLDYRRISA